MTKSGTALSHLRMIQQALEARGVTEETVREDPAENIHAVFRMTWEREDMELELEHVEDGEEGDNLGLSIIADDGGRIEISWFPNYWWINDHARGSRLHTLRCSLPKNDADNFCSEEVARKAIDLIADFFAKRPAQN